jgi:hypothetical protein
MNQETKVLTRYELEFVKLFSRKIISLTAENAYFEENKLSNIATKLSEHDLDFLAYKMGKKEAHK